MHSVNRLPEQGSQRGQVNSFMLHELSERHGQNFAHRELSRNAHIRVRSLNKAEETSQHAHMSTRHHVHLKAHRLAKGLTQEQVANIAGVRNNTISGWESGARTLDLEDLETLARIYEVHPSALLMDPAEGPKAETMRIASEVARSLDTETAEEWVRIGQRLAKSVKPS
jgi:transcriptional regulator with XRE-family HTH domain